MTSFKTFITYKNTTDLKATRFQNNKESNNNIQNNNINSEFKILKNSDNNNTFSIIGDRFIPYKNKLDNNMQNYILNSSPFNINLSNSSNEKDSSSSIERKPEKNYVNFVIDNMLKSSSENYIIKNNTKTRQKKIFYFSKKNYRTAYKERPLCNNYINNIIFSTKKDNINNLNDDSIL